MVDRVRHRKAHYSGHFNQDFLPDLCTKPIQGTRLQENHSQKHSTCSSWKSLMLCFMRQYSWIKASKKKRLFLAFSVGIGLFHLNNLLFGQNCLHGGILGRLIDSTLRTVSFRLTLARRDQNLHELGIQLPKLTQPNVNKRGIPVITQSYLAETVLRATERASRHAAAERWDQCGIPSWVLQPNSGRWFRPLYGASDVLEFDEFEMRAFMSKHFPSLPQDDVAIWGLCAAFFFGGIFVSHQVQDLDSLSRMLSIETPLDNDGKSCRDIAAFHFQGDSLLALKATPRHPLIACAIQKLQTNARNQTVIPSLLFNDLTLGEHTWFKSACPRDSLACCDISRSQASDGTLLIDIGDYHEEVSAAAIDGPRVNVLVEERPAATSPKKVPKHPIAQILAETGCKAGWICNRCLKSNWFGSYQACASVCSSCYERTICHSANFPARTDVSIDVIVEERRAFNPNKDKRIPRIIHQTFFEELTPDRYPHLYRFQKALQATGWNYRFYTDTTARSYILANFPSRFADAFDGILPGAFKADFFRMLVLLKEGGVYFDVDVKLDVDLDAFITPNLGFFVPRDLVAGHGDGNYCLWNGMVGAAPGHPFVVNAVERILNMVLNRCDYYDMEQEVCRYSAQSSLTEVWKVRALDILLLTGPCALGVSVNSSLGRNSSVSKFDTGWLPLEPHLRAYGDVLILMADKYDLGELRFTDIDRNVLVASTEQTLLTKNAFETFVSNLDHLEHHRAKPHYSTKEHSSDVFGSSGIYLDNLVTKENYRLRTRDRQKHVVLEKVNLNQPKASHQRFTQLEMRSGIAR